jgi:predicted nucleic acid-binding protein
MLLDTSAWIEFFRGTPEGKYVAEVLHTEDCYTSIVTLAELSHWALKEKQDISLLISIVKQLSVVINLDNYIAILAGQLNFERKKIVKKWGMLDSFVLATGRTYNLTILAKDGDFDNLFDAKKL